MVQRVDRVSCRQDIRTESLAYFYKSIRVSSRKLNVFLKPPNPAASLFTLSCEFPIVWISAIRLCVAYGLEPSTYFENGLACDALICVDFGCNRGEIRKKFKSLVINKAQLYRILLRLPALLFHYFLELPGGFGERVLLLLPSENLSLVTGLVPKLGGLLELLLEKLPLLPFGLDISDDLL